MCGGTGRFHLINKAYFSVSGTFFVFLKSFRKTTSRLISSDSLRAQNPEIIEIYIEGLSINRIGEQLGISSATPGDT
jgi:DNA-binding NarL/FixJ family response regulator